MAKFYLNTTSADLLMNSKCIDYYHLGARKKETDHKKKKHKENMTEKISWSNKNLNVGKNKLKGSSYN